MIMVNPAVKTSAEELAQEIEWDGRGLPPVGTICNYESGCFRMKCENESGYGVYHSIPKSNIWKVKILWTYKDNIVIELAGGGVMMVRDLIKFSPLKSESEVRRNETVKQMVKDSSINPATTRDYIFCQCLYDAGYRKIE